MVTLASSTITCIVRELTASGSTTETYHFPIDYGGVGDGVTVNNTALSSFQTANSGSANKVRLYLPEGDYAVNNLPTFCSGFSNIEVLGDTPSGGVWPTEMTQGFLAFTADGLRESNLYSARIEAASLGATTVTVKDRDVSGTGRTLAQIMALFTVGDWLLITEGDTQGFGWPINPTFMQFCKITGKTTNTISFSGHPLTRAYSDTTPEFNTASTDFGGPATIYALQSFFEMTGLLKNVQFNNSIQTYINSENATFENVHVTGGFAPSFARSARLVGGRYDGEIEIDKLLEFVELDGVTVNDNVVTQSGHVTQLEIRNSTIEQFVGTAYNTVIEDTDFTDAGGTNIIGCIGYGFSKSLVCINVDFAGPIAGVNRPYRLEGCTYTGSVIKGFQMAISSPTSAPTVGHTITGGTSGATATVLHWNSDFNHAMLGSVSGIFQVGESVSTPTMSGTFLSNVFGQEFAGTGALLILGTTNAPCAVPARVVRYYTDGQFKAIETDVVSWPSYSDGALVTCVPSPCQDITFTNCTGQDWAIAWSQAPANFVFGSWSRAWMGSDGDVTASQTVYGRLVSMTVNVTRAYTGALGALKLTLGPFGGRCLELPAGNWTGYDNKTDLKVTGTRVYSPDGNSGLTANDVANSGGQDVNLTAVNFKLLDGSNNVVTLEAEDEALWPEFTVTIVTDI